MTIKPQRRRFQFSLRMLLGAFTILACVSALIGYTVKKWNDGAESRRFWRTNELILSNGGYWGRDGVGMSASLHHASRGQLDMVLKELKSFDDQTSMSFSDSEFGDSHVTEILGHRDLRNLMLKNTLVTDNGLKDIDLLKELVDLELDNTVVTDAGLEHLVILPELQYLSLDNTAITDAGLEHLAKLPKLEHLHVTGTKVTEEGIAKLKRSLPNLEVNVYYGR